jgi:hypothetical protein
MKPRTVITYGILTLLLLMTYRFVHAPDAVVQPRQRSAEQVHPLPAGAGGSESPRDTRITLAEPRSNDSLASPFVVRGRVQTSHDAITVRVVSDDGYVVIEEVARVDRSSADAPGDFRIALNYIFERTHRGFIEVITYDQDNPGLVRVPVAFAEVGLVE